MDIYTTSMADQTVTDTISDASHAQRCGCMHCAGGNMAAQNQNIAESLATQSEYGDSGTTGGAADLFRGLYWAGTSTSGTTLTYNFFNSVPTYYSSSAEERNGFDPFTRAMKTVTREILSDIETFTNITFQEVNTTNSHLGFAQARLPSNVGGWAYYPGGGVGRVTGDVWVNKIFDSAQNPKDGEYGKYLLLHEIGHALGLRHSFDVLSGAEASSQFSVMAYDWSPYFPASFMLYDVYALQQVYGANMDHATGDDVYALRNRVAYTIWDAGGEDTFSTEHINSNVVINLNEGHFSSVGKSNNIAIAFGVTIENATTGSGNDKITGNYASNILSGNAGDDIFIGSGGSDTINGGSGYDTIIYNTDISDFLVSIVNYDIVLSDDYSSIGYGDDTINSVEQFIFNGVTYNFDDIISYSTGYDTDGRPLLSGGYSFADSDVSYGRIGSSPEINLSISTNKTIGLAFETSDDVDSRQVLFDQGGGLRGMNIYIENGELHYAAWNYRAGTEWGYKETSTAIDANTRYTSAFVFDAPSQSSGTLEIHLNGMLQSTVSGAGHIYSESRGVGVGMMIDESRFSDGNKRGDGYTFQGIIDRIAYYNHTLDSSELDQLNQHLDFDWMVNLAPTAQDDDATILTDTPTQIDVLSNDSDPNGDFFDVTLVTQGANGTVVLNADDTVLYTPDNGYTGTDSFTYTVEDEEGLATTATVNVTVTDQVAVNAPSGSVFSNDSVTYGQISNSNDINLTTATNKTIGLAFETSNDVDSRQVLFDQGSGLRGMNIYIENGELHYAAWNYRAGTQWGYKETSVSIDANTRYTSAFVFEAFSQSSGTLDIYLNGSLQSSVSGAGYIFPDDGGAGVGMMIDESRFSDGNKRGDGYVFQGAINNIAYYNETLDSGNLDQLNQNLEFDWMVNLAPSAQDDNATVITDTPTRIDVLSNDSDPNGDPLDVTSITQGTNGTVVLNADDTVLYTPDNGYTGSDSFTYTVQDDEGLSTTATVNVTVTNQVAVNAPTGSVFIDNNVTHGQISSSGAINLSTSTEKTIGLAFQTGGDVSSRQVLFEQGGGLRGMNVFIEDGELHYAAWNYRAGTQWIYKETSTSIDANTDYTSAFVFDAPSASNGTLNIYLNGSLVSSIGGAGYIHAENAGVGIGMMIDQSRFSDGNVRGNGFSFQGTISDIAYYDQALNSSDLNQLDQYLQYVASHAPPPPEGINIEDVLQIESDDILFEGIDTSIATVSNSNQQSAALLIESYTNNSEDVLNHLIV